MPLASKEFDIFLSYKSENAAWAEKLQRSLQIRGVKVWLDKDQIRPGDRFAEALENGIKTCKSVGLIVTPESVASQWVKEEYYRALSYANEGTLQLIPILLEKTEMPGFLSSRHYIDFSDNTLWEQNVDHLIWPGITGKTVEFVTWCEEQTFHETWSRFVELGREIGLKISDWDRLYRLPSIVSSEGYFPSKNTRVVLVFDIFDKTGYPGYTPTPQYYIDNILKIREETKGTPREIVFLLHQNSKAWMSDDAKKIDPEIADRLKHYFTINHDCYDDNQFKFLLRDIWHRIQQELINTER